VTATQIAAGGEHICALTSAGTVQCWGDDSSGQLGYDPSTFTNPGVPMPVNGLPAGVTAITAGSSHTCALATDGSVWCWGSCQFGEIGGGCTSASFTPIKVLSGATSIAAGGAHTCAVLTGGGAQCWGQNNYGQLGFGSSNSSIPLTVKSASVPAGSSLAAGQYHNCVLNSTGVIACWGSDMFGELGGVTTLSPISAVTAGTFSTCALSQGGAYCRGRNSVGQLGNGVSDGPSSTTTHPGFTSVIGLTSGVTAIASGDDHVCAVDSNTTVECWGDFRTNAMAYVNATPIMVTGATALAAGSVFSCAVTSTGLWCWGRGTNGELGDGTFMTNDLPVQVMEP
jgi:alpha-tubulin suppressor-like RCC1 family protein